MRSKKITVNIPEYIQSIVDLEDKIIFSRKPPIAIPKMKYPSDKKYWNKASVYAFIQGILP